MKKHTILFLAANPAGTPRRALEEEARAIQAELDRSGNRDYFKLETRWAAQPLDLLRELRKLKPTIVHFSGHGGLSPIGAEVLDRRLSREISTGAAPDYNDPQRGLFFQGSDRRAQVVTTQALNKTFGAAGASVKLVVLSACYSDDQAELLRAHVDCVVGMRGTIDENTARSFAVGFYGGLGECESVAVAFHQGCAAISLEGLRDSDRPQLRVRDDVDANKLMLSFPVSHVEIGDAEAVGVQPVDAGLRNARLGGAAQRDILRSGDTDISRRVDPGSVASPSSDFTSPAAQSSNLPRRSRLFMIGGISAAIIGGIIAIGIMRAETRGCPKGMVQVPAGVFWMGSPDKLDNERPQHQVKLPSYCIDETEATVENYIACVETKGCPQATYTVDVEGGDPNYDNTINRFCNRPLPEYLKHPINCVDWYQANRYCELNNKRLPSEQEWEYAARGRDKFEFPWGNDWPNARRLNACGAECAPMVELTKKQVVGKRMYNINDGWQRTAPVGLFPEGKSPFDVLDMAGNVWEWTADLNEYYSGASNPNNATARSWRVLRGGSWQAVEPDQVRTAIRLPARPSMRNTDFGFRCAKDLPR